MVLDMLARSKILDNVSKFLSYFLIFATTPHQTNLYLWGLENSFLSHDLS